MSETTGRRTRDAFIPQGAFNSAKLVGAHFDGSVLNEADFSNANLAEAEFSRANLGLTNFGNVDLSTAGLGRARHSGPSIIGIDTLVKTLGGSGGAFTEEQLSFFSGARVPQQILDALPSIMAKVEFHSCFISYGEPDLAFVEQLNANLKSRGVSSWMYNADATPGARSWHEIKQEMRTADRIVLVCSADALLRDGLLKEFEELIDEYPEKLVPISLDETWKHPGFRVIRGARDLKPSLTERNYADFAKLPYEEALSRLLKGLRRQRTV